MIVVQGADLPGTGAEVIGPALLGVYPAGDGPGVTVEGQAVMMAGLVETCEAQRPIRYDAAACVSESEPDHALIQPMTFLMNSAFPQKQFESALSLHPDMYIQVFKQRGSVPGQFGVGYGPGADELDTGATGLLEEP